MSSNVVALPSGPERRRRNPFVGGGRHRRTPEAWAEMQRENDALRAKVASTERDLAWSQNKVDHLEGQVDEMGRQMNQLIGEVREMRALMGSDVSNQQTVTIIPPHKGDPEETQPISQAELFKDGDTMSSLRPVIRVGEIKPPDTVSSDAATQLLDRISSQSEKVKHVDVTQPIPLWDSPLAQSYRVENRHTA